MKMSKNYKRLCLALGLAGVVGAGTVTAQSGTKNIAATYKDIQVTYNGVRQEMAVEPFLVNGSVYVPLRAVSTIFNAEPTWVPTTNTVSITGGNTSSATNEAELVSLKYQVETLTAQLNAANTELATLKANASNNATNNTTNGSSTSNSTSTGTNITNEQLKETENYLNSNFCNELSNNISMYYTLSLSGNQINVDISYETRSENTAYEKLSQSKIETFIKKVCENIAATHNDIVINGTIEYTKESEEKVAFQRNKNGKYEYNHSFDNESLADLLEDETSGYFTFNNISPSSLSITNYDVNVNERRTTVNVKLSLSSDANFRTKWGTTSAPAADSFNEASRRNAVEQQLDYIQEVIADATNDYDVNIYVYYNGSSNLIAQMDTNGRISVYTID